MHADIHAYTHAYIHTYIHEYIRTFVHTCMHTRIHAYMHTCIHTCMHTCMHACIHTYTHTHVYKAGLSKHDMPRNQQPRKLVSSRSDTFNPKVKLPYLQSLAFGDGFQQSLSSFVLGFPLRLVVFLVCRSFFVDLFVFVFVSFVSFVFGQTWQPARQFGIRPLLQPAQVIFSKQFVC